LVTVLGLIVAQPAFAVHDLEFQLDGDVSASTTTNVGGTTQTIDWDSLFDANGDELGLPANFTASGFHRDFLVKTSGSFDTSDQTTFSTGSKDTLPITPGWQCNFDNNVNSKIDVMNAYAAAYTAPNGHEILYFGLERNTNTGDANVAFWFLQDDVDCSSTGGSAPFTGDHTDGDLLVVSAFTKGGGVSTIDVYRWNGGAGGSLGTTSVAHGADCKTTTGGDDVCATTNSGTLPINTSITTPWLTANFKDGVGHTLQQAEFFEGGLDLTANELGGKCFNVFIADTRSSQSLTATLFDFTRGSLGECTLSMTTTPSQTTRVIGSTDPITDTADVVGHTGGGGTAPTPTGTVDFFLCGPADLTPPDTGTCQGTSGTAVPGNPVTVTEKVPGTATATSGDASSLITGIGKYCFRAEFTAAADDTNYPGQTAHTDNLADECFTVTGTASLSTAQDWLPNDSATLTGDANLNGTLTFTLYTGDNCGATSGAPVTGQSYTVNVLDATSGSEFSTSNETFTVKAADAGSYSWLVHYDDNTLADPADRCETSSVSITD
jgi:hypothetical protein